MNAREAAFISLERIEKGQKYSSLEIDAIIKKHNLQGAEKSLYSRLVYGVTERLLTLDFIFDTLSNKPRKNVDSKVLGAVRLGLYQMMFLDKIPDSAAINESVKLTKKYVGASAGAFTNAVLRGFQRSCPEKTARANVEDLLKCEKYKVDFEKLGKYEKLSIIYSYPQWLCKKFADDYSFDDALKIMSHQNGKVPLTLRVNTLKCDRDKLLELLSDMEIIAYPTELSPFGLKIKEQPDFSKIQTLINEGLCFVQDEASQLCTVVLAPKKNEIIIDACACPGGKSFSSAIIMNNTGKIISCDLHKSKLSLIKDTSEKLGISVLDIRESDSSKYTPDIVDENETLADRVLCDVPCSGLGVIGKKPEIRYKDRNDIERLPSVQLKILENCSKYVKSGGVLVYSTCTLNPLENEENVKAFLNKHSEFSPVDFVFGENNVKSTDGMLTLFPHINNTDGFFIAKMKKA